MILTEKGIESVKTIKATIDNLVSEGYTPSNALDKARFDNGQHPGCLFDLAIDHGLINSDWETLVQQGYAKRVL